jgi:hypothetical protein
LAAALVSALTATLAVVAGVVALALGERGMPTESEAGIGRTARRAEADEQGRADACGEERFAVHAAARVTVAIIAVRLPILRIKPSPLMRRGFSMPFRPRKIRWQS